MYWGSWVLAHNDKPLLVPQLNSMCAFHRKQFTKSSVSTIDGCTKEIDKACKLGLVGGFKAWMEAKGGDYLSFVKAGFEEKPF